MKKEPSERVVCGIFENREQANQAVDALADTDIASEDISVITNKKDFEEEQIKEIAGDPLHEESIQAAKIGGVAGFILGGVTAMVGFWMGGSGILTAAPLILIIASVVGVLGALIEAGFEENQATTVDEAIREGKVFMAVHSRDRDAARRAESILRECHAQGVHHY